MSREHLTLVLVGFSSLTACGGGTPEPVKPLQGAPLPVAKAEAVPEIAPAVESAAPEDETMAPKHDDTFASGDPEEIVQITTRKAWSLGSGDSWNLSVYDYVRADGTKNVFKQRDGKGTFAIPGAFTMPARPAQGLKKGDPVYVPVVEVAACARVLSVSGTKVKVAYMWPDQRVEATYPLDEVLPFDGTLGYGQPVAFKTRANEAAWMAGHLVYMNPHVAWIEGNYPVAPELVKPIDIKKIHQPGDKVLALRRVAWGTLSPAIITRVLDDGLEYEIQEASGQMAIAPYCQVTDLLK